MADRVHMLPYVPHWQVSDYLSSADAAVSPLHHLPNHEIALSNKFFEYAHARLPLITSDIRTMAEMVRSTGQGEVFKAQDLDDFVRVVRTVLADPQQYRDAYDRDDLLLELDLGGAGRGARHGVRLADAGRRPGEPAGHQRGTGPGGTPAAGRGRPMTVAPGARTVAVVTPWYPTRLLPFRGAFVQAMVEATAPGRGPDDGDTRRPVVGQGLARRGRGDRPCAPGAAAAGRPDGPPRSAAPN